MCNTMYLLFLRCDCVIVFEAKHDKINARVSACDRKYQFYHTTLTMIRNASVGNMYKGISNHVRSDSPVMQVSLCETASTYEPYHGDESYQSDEDQSSFPQTRRMTLGRSATIQLPIFRAFNKQTPLILCRSESDGNIMFFNTNS